MLKYQPIVAFGTRLPPLIPLILLTPLIPLILVARELLWIYPGDIIVLLTN